MTIKRPVSDAELLYYSNRMVYTKKAIAFVLDWNPKTVLELGAAYMKLFFGGDTMGIDPSFFIPTFFHDATVVPWPIADKAYDVFLSLQVWEHLNGGQQRAFLEAKRVAHHAVLSFPLRWNDCPPGDDHYMITEEKIAEWTMGETPVKRFIAHDNADRLILAFDFGDQA